MHGLTDFFSDREIAGSGDDLLPCPGPAEHLAPGVNDSGIATVLGLPRFSAGVAAGQIHLIFNGPGLGEHLQMGNADIRPLGHHEEQLQPRHGHGTGQLREADVIADEDAHIMAVHPEPAYMVPFFKIIVLSHGRKQMGLVVLGNHFSLPVKDTGGVVHPVSPEAGHGARHDVDAQLLG